MGQPRVAAVGQPAAVDLGDAGGFHRAVRIVEVEAFRIPLEAQELDGGTSEQNASLQRFLARAGKNGLTVLNQSGRLRTVRVRYDSFGDFMLERGLIKAKPELDTYTAEVR